MQIDDYNDKVAAKMREAGLIELADKLESDMFFVAACDVEEILAFDHETILLVRCSNGRFTTPIKGLAAWLELIRMGCTEYGYLRDVSIPAVYRGK
jgi:hypothetical protein